MFNKILSLTPKVSVKIYPGSNKIIFFNPITERVIKEVSVIGNNNKLTTEECLYLYNKECVEDTDFLPPENKIRTKRYKGNNDE